MNFFGRRKAADTQSASAAKTKSANVEPGAALQNIRTRIDALEKRVEFLEKKMHANLVDAKKYSQAKNKSAAMQALKRKKMHEKEVDKLRAAIANLEQQAFTIENASVTVDIVSGMKAGKAAIASIQKEVNIDDLEDLRDDIAEQMQMQQEVDDILGNPLGDLGDEDDLLAELDELDGEEEDLDELESEMTKVGVRPERERNESLALPKAPAGAVHIQQTKVIEEDEDAKALAELEAEMAI